MKFSTNKKLEILLLSIIVLLAIVFRYWLVSGDRILFWYDQARDAHISRQIIEHRDLKIQGPSASGTNDTLYHGVLYYYLIAPVYTFSHGDPMSVTIFLLFINAFSVVIFYFLLRSITQNNFGALLGALMLAFSFEHAEYSTWLSNPTISLIPILLFYLWIWNFFYKQDKRIPWWSALALGIINQSAIYTIFNFGSILIGLGYIFYYNKSLKYLKQIPLFQYVKFILIYLISISTILLTQWRLFRANIFTLHSVSDAVGHALKYVDLSQVLDLINAYLNKFMRTMSPHYTILGFVVLVLMIVGFKYIKLKERYFLLSWIFAPLWMFIFHFRDSTHTYIGIEYPLIILAILILLRVKFGRLQKLIMLMVVGYFILQIYAVYATRLRSDNFFTSHPGWSLADQKQLLDKTYLLANQQPFSISTWTSPYGYNITFAYLYDWYGRQRYGYTPSYFGPNQSGLVGAELLPQSDSVELIHFVIEEPFVDIFHTFYDKFIATQDAYAPSVSGKIENFGGFKLDYRRKK